MPIPDFVVELRRMVGTHPLWLPGVTAVVSRGAEVLLVRRADNGAWTPVTGIVDPGEEPAVAAAREVLEETGVSCRVDRLAATSAVRGVVHANGDRASYLDLTFACTWLDGEAHVADDESSDVGWFGLDHLPVMSDVMRDRIEAALSTEVAARFVTDQEAEQVPAAPWAPAGPVLGVDACAGGWVGVAADPSGRLTVHAARTIDELVEQVRESVDPVVAAIDIPIGLPDEGGRLAETLVRRELGRKASSVFATLTRAAYTADTYAEAREANLAATGGTSASAQAYALRDKILEVDAWLRATPAPGMQVIEVHPELSFARLAGAPIAARKKDDSGARARRDALAAQGIRAPYWSRGFGFAEDDLLDACAAAWSAGRHLAGASECFPPTPEVFGDGLAAAIRV